jgi:glycine/D-amino acid oxidase-like deaminating enzyme/nitrite reductase/ring-hydroxylating ferredoxin subunit
MRVDAAIVGGGIVGVTAAHFLKEAGLKVAVVEGRKVGRQVTGKSTAKITSQHGLIYHTLAEKFGEDGARTYAEANQAAIGRITELARTHGIDCDLEPKAAFVYARTEQHVATLEREVEVAQRVGLPASFVRDPGLPYPVAGAIRFDGQAQFHPCKYVAGLARTIPGDGCHVFEDTRALDVEPGRVVTARGVIEARHIIVATHLPLGKIGFFFAQAHPYNHCMVAAPLDPARSPDGMFISVDQPTHSVRTHRGDDGTLRVVAVGSQYKPGHTDEERKGFMDLEAFLRDAFGIETIEYRWTNMDYGSMDGMPFIGRSSAREDAFFVATGFNAWGITGGTVAGILLADLVAGRPNPWAALFDATRIKPAAGGATFLKENLQVAKHLLTGYLSRRPNSPNEVRAGEAAILDQGATRKLAVYRDEGGRLHTVSAVCSHMGCVLGWNETERTWECPCHGSRFTVDGEVIHGPATQPLKRNATD